MRFALALLMSSCVLVSCERVASDTTATAFSARVGGEPYPVRLPAACTLNRFNNDEAAQWLFSFESTDGEGALHLGMAVGDHRPGPREVAFVLLNHRDASYSQVREGMATLTAMQKTGTDWRMSGRFDLVLEGSSMASGHPETREIRIDDAEFRDIDCIAPPAASSSSG
jgi:hypothetical protein